MTDHRALLVELWSPDLAWVPVGVLHHVPETTWFEPLPDYWDLSPRPVLCQRLEESGRSWRPSSRVRLPTWFSHLLPEARLRSAIAEAAGVNEKREFFLLAAIGGDDLPGALRVRTADPEHVADVPTPQDPPSTSAGNQSAFKFSLAGVQLKFSVVDSATGLTIPASGQAGRWIAKLPDQRPGFEGVPEAELAGLEFARACGVDVPDAQLVPVDDIDGLPDWAHAPGREALLVRRFDRTDDGGRVHVEELAQVLEVPTGVDNARYRYANFETLARVTGALCGPEAVGDIIDRLVVNVLVGNGDAHVKNWAFTYPDGRNPRLSPAYDIVPTVLFIPNDDLGLKLADSRRFEDVSLRAFERLTDKAGWDGTEGRKRAADAVERCVAAWPTLSDHLSPDAVSRLTDHRDRLRLLRR